MTKNNYVFRTLPEQVEQNKQDIAAHYDVDRVLADFGIRVLGQVDTAAALPATAEQYGDAYAVGVEAPYDFYIWTRANNDAGHPNDYWFNIGALAIVGPRGPVGPQGEKGRPAKWYIVSGYPNVPEAENGDVAVSTANDIYGVGAIFYKTNGGWVLSGNIRGPKGETGATIANVSFDSNGRPTFLLTNGLTITSSFSLTGPQGPRGEQGERGSTGGLVDIIGILSSAAELPTPSQLGNTKKAYLIGTSNPYNLYIQVGETPATAYWENVGAVNAATYVSVNGNYVNTWNADTKLDKYSNPTNFNTIYGKNSAGQQINYQLDHNNGFPSSAESLGRRANWNLLNTRFNWTSAQDAACVPKVAMNEVYENLFPVGSYTMHLPKTATGANFGIWEDRQTITLNSGDTIIVYERVG